MTCWTRLIPERAALLLAAAGSVAWATGSPATCSPSPRHPAVRGGCRSGGSASTITCCGGMRHPPSGISRPCGRQAVQPGWNAALTSCQAGRAHRYCRPATTPAATSSWCRRRASTGQPSAARSSTSGRETYSRQISACGWKLSSAATRSTCSAAPQLSCSRPTQRSCACQVVIWPACRPSFSCAGPGGRYCPGPSKEPAAGRRPGAGPQLSAASLRSRPRTGPRT